jgi:iron complex transport system permease protein
VITGSALARRWTKAVRESAATPRVPGAVVLSVLAVVLVIAALLGVSQGAVSIDPAQVIAIIAHHLGVDLGVAYSQQQDAVVWAIRLPRVTLGLLVGGALGVAGAAMQGMFRNPLADPGLIGVSSGAALGAVLVTALGIGWLGLMTVPTAAALGAIAPAIAVYLLARHDGRTEIVTLILIGIALTTFLGACTALMTYISGDPQSRDVLFWSLGGLGSATWRSVGAITPFILIGLAAAPRWGRALNLFALGEREARHLGVDTERVRLELLLLTALMTGATVAGAGVVTFVGLIVPHLIRLVAGPDHRTLLPASALAGAALLLFADLAARTVVAPAEVPLGVVTAFLGGPFLLLLLIRTRRAQGGWG